MKSFLKCLLCAMAAVFMTVTSFAQDRTVTGTVSATNGEALIGAGVVIKGTTTGTVTDLEGRFSLSVPSNAVLQFTSVGYKTLDVKIGNKSKIDVILEDDAQLLEEAVAIGYANQSKLTLTGSVASTSGRELVKNSSVNLSQGLAGRLSGVIINNRSGEPGRDDATMFIRGRSTFGNNSPLIIIDGIEGRDEEFSRLTGEEIESVNVLKDASAAIYGARSANGVILVTTKRGKFNEAPNITFNYDLGLQQPTRLVEMADAVLYTNAYNDELAITGAAPKYNQTQLDLYASGSDPILYPNTNYFKEIIKPVSQQHKYGVSIDGGGDKVGYFVQFNGQFQDGIYVKSATNYQQYNIRSNIDIKVTDNFKLGVNLNVRQQHKNYSAFPSDAYGIFYIATRLKPTGAAYYPNGKIRGGTNPAVMVQDITGYDRSIINTINATLTADIDLKKITPGLKINGSFAYDVNNNFKKNFQKNWKYWSYDEITELYTEHTMSYWSSPTLHEYLTRTNSWTANVNLNYDRDFDGHHVTGLLGYEQHAFHRDYFSAGINSFASDILDEFFAGSADKSWYSINGNARETARLSFFGRLGYDYQSKYLFQFIARYDGSENFAKGHRWGFFPGASAGWRISEESFIKDNAPWIQNLKLRLSYGEQGNDQIDPFQYMTTYEYATGVSYWMRIDNKDISSIVPGTIPNENVTWEVARTWNVGLDGNIFKGKFSWELEYFNTRRSNILCTRNASIPYYTGLTSNLPDENIGIVSNRGVEIQLSHENRVANGDFIYRINGNFLYAKNRVEYMDETPWGAGHEYMNQTGHPMGAGLYYQVEGINKTQTDLDGHPQMSGATLGDFYFKDLDGDGKITTYDRLRCDMTTVPEIVFGLSGNFQWKNLDFSILFQGQARARFYYAPQMDPVSYNVEANAARNAWSLKNTGADYPRLGSNVSNGGTTSSSFYYRNADFVRLKNVELGYTFPHKMFGEKVPVKGIRVYVGGYNLFTLSELKTIDPESNDGSAQTYPQTRIFNFGAKLMF
ncbi:MAG: TonB-dependent receptor [Bacteroidales bacterium]|nr:TonB-dependent receptor [Candidatus Cryptobacteroides fimicaballi]